MQKLLFVDDEINYLHSIARLLKNHATEWESFFANSAQNACELIQCHDFDVIVTDVRMPKKSGIELLEELQADERTRTIPVVILTGSIDSDLKRIALEKGATDLLNKPIQYEDLVARLNSALKLKSYQDELVQHNLILEKKVKQRTIQLEYMHRDLIYRLAKAGEFRDEDTGNHVIRVAKYSKRIAEILNLSDELQNLIFYTAPLHDLGKIGIPDNILLKKGPLTPEERLIMETHCEIGASILLENPQNLEDMFSNQDMDMPEYIQKDKIKQYAASIAMTHHEWWDGSGYPKKLKENDIPIQGRIVAFADVYDALCSKRSYKEGYSTDHAWDILKQGSGTHFDPIIFETITKYKKDFEYIHDHY